MHPDMFRNLRNARYSTVLSQGLRNPANKIMLRCHHIVPFTFAQKPLES